MTYIFILIQWMNDSTRDPRTAWSAERLVRKFWGFFGPGAGRSDFSKISSVPGLDRDFTVGFWHVFDLAYDTYKVSYSYG